MSEAARTAPAELDEPFGFCQTVQAAVDGVPSVLVETTFLDCDREEVFLQDRRIGLIAGGDASARFEAFELCPEWLAEALRPEVPQDRNRLRVRIGREVQKELDKRIAEAIWTVRLFDTRR